MSAPRILILVLSCRRPPYVKLQRAQERTWASVSVEGVETVFYHNSDLRRAPNALATEIQNAFQHENFKSILGLRQGWDFVFRTNASSYVDKRALQDFARQLPRRGCYLGIDGDGFASGSGFFLSHDVADALATTLPMRACDITCWGLAEDELVGRALAGAGVGVLPGARRYDYWHRRLLLGLEGKPENADDEEIRAAYHVRCKSDSASRKKDVIAMEAVHAIKGYE